jgi:SNF2 family DNA or RNA helicase
MTSLKDPPEWEVSYKTSDVTAEGVPVDILHHFYIPVLKRCVRYDRVAGYFRSSSLAAASQGFSAFTENEGKMRLVVGCDLDPADVAVILHGGADAEKKAAEALGAGLGDESQWPEEVVRGVQLLGWMLQRGQLEMKVAFRVHSETGEPISADSTQDGYVHEKWALFYDDEGNALQIEGSLNESRTALAKNAENLSVSCAWWSEKHAETVEKGRVNFDRVWNDESPALRVMSLPAAVKARLLKLGENVKIPLEIDGTTAVPPEIPPPDSMELLRWAVIADAPKMPGGRYVGMTTAPVAPWPHQEVVARRLIGSWPYHWMLCDEVGLGKTIESGLALRGLYLSGLAKRILIASPASVASQWQREMANKFLMPFWLATSAKYEALHPRPEIRWSKTVYDEDLIIVSTALMSRDERRKELKAADRFDVALVDEAHYARRGNLKPDQNARVQARPNRLLQTIADSVRPQCRSLWLASATPMQLDPIEVSDLIAVVGRVGAFQHDPTLTQAYYDILGKLVRDADPSPEEWAFLREAIRSLEYTDPILWSYLRETVVDAKIRQDVKRWLEGGHIPRGTARRDIRRFIFAAAPLSRVMLRHTRALLEVYKEKGQLAANLAVRHILPIPAITFTVQEQAAYDELEVYCNKLRQQIERHSTDKSKRTAMGFYLSFLRLRFASSLFAIRATIERRIKRAIATLDHHDAGSDDSSVVDWDDVLSDGDEVDDEEVVKSFLKDRTAGDLEWEIKHLKGMRANLADLSGPSSKMQVLFQTLHQRRDAKTGRVRQTVIFSRFFDTVSDIRDRLRNADPQMLIATYSGQGAGGQYVSPRNQYRLLNVDRDIVKRKFIQGEIDVLICTDAAAEGLNLQTADLLVNFDLPWNPMKVEQRIGRIDRIGQRYSDIYVLNLCYPGSAEEAVYDRLLQRLAKAGNVVGQQQVSMLPVTPEDFRDLADKTLTPEALEAKALIRLESQKQREATTQMPPKEMHDIYVRLSKAAAGESTPITLEQIGEAVYGSRHLRDLGCVVTGEGEPRHLILSGVDAVGEGARLTISRKLFEDGTPTGEAVRFASYGDPVFSGLVRHFAGFDLPPGIRRLQVPVEDFDTERVAYVVAVANSPEEPLRLVTGYADLAGLVLDPEREITDQDVEALLGELKRLADAELDPVRAVTRVHRINEEAAAAERWLATAIAAYYLEQRAKLTGEDGFWPVIKDIDDQLLRKTTLTAQLSPLDGLRKIKPKLLFEVTAPELGESGHIEAPRLLLKAAVDTACRIAEGTRQKKSDLTASAMVGRLRGELK